MSQIALHEGDNRETLRRLIDEGVRVHSVVTDPPYGLVSVTKRFGGEKAAPAKFGTDGAFSRASAGFMGSKWDGTGIERDPEFWRLVWEILLPGGYCIAFSGARTGHWQACAMETAGFIMHPMKGWVFGSGFPKAHNAAKAIDKKLGREGGVTPSGAPVKRMIPGAQQNATGDWTKTDDRAYQPGQYEPATPEAEQWSGWAYGTQATKPALEPIYVGQKPFSEKDGVLNLLRWGVGAMNIDSCRVATADDLNGGAYSADRKPSSSDWVKHGGTIHSYTGRHPANLVHDGSPEVVALFPSSGGSGPARTLQRSQIEERGGWGMNTTEGDTVDLRDAGTGSAARFFNSFPVTDADPVRYQAKASKADRAGSKHPTVKPIALIEWLITLVTPPGGTVLDPFAGSGTTGQAARNLGFDCVLMEADAQFAADIRRRFDLNSPVTTDFDDILCGTESPFADVLG